MSFSDWCAAVQPALDSDARLKANFLNLMAEDRVPGASTFRSSVGAQFAKDASKDVAAAQRCLIDHIALLAVPTSTWLGLLQSPSKDHEAWSAVTYITARHIEKYLDTSFDASASRLPRRVTLHPPFYMTPTAAPFKRFIWVSSLPSTKDLGPTDLVLSLGLPHFLPGEAVYRIEFAVWPSKVFIPTCLDAGLYCAWAIPAKAHRAPWGLSRHLKTGARPHPELLIEVAALQARPLVAEHVVGPGGESVINTYAAHYLLRRGRRGL